jgi:hypothetical protein
MYALKAQTSGKPQIWVDANTSFGLLDFDPFKLGLGGGFQLSFDKPINAKSKAGLHFGFNRMGNYNRTYGEYTYNVLPSGFQHVNHTIKIQSLSFLDAGLHFKHRPNVTAPWSWSMGLNASILIAPTGQDFRQSSINLREPEISEEEYVTGFISGASSSSGSLSQEDFAAYDLSAEAAIYYNITKGCDLRAAFRQGTRNLIKPDVSPSGNAQHYLSTLSIGFSARLR